MENDVCRACAKAIEEQAISAESAIRAIVEAVTASRNYEDFRSTASDLRNFDAIQRRAYAESVAPVAGDGGNEARRAEAFSSAGSTPPHPLADMFYDLLAEVARPDGNPQGLAEAILAMPRGPIGKGD